MSDSILDKVAQLDKLQAENEQLRKMNRKLSELYAGAVPNGELVARAERAEKHNLALRDEIKHLHQQVRRYTKWLEDLSQQTLAEVNSANELNDAVTNAISQLTLHAALFTPDEQVVVDLVKAQGKWLGMCGECPACGKC